METKDFQKKHPLNSNKDLSESECNLAAFQIHLVVATVYKCVHGYIKYFKICWKKES